MKKARSLNLNKLGIIFLIFFSFLIANHSFAFVGRGYYVSKNKVVVKRQTRVKIANQEINKNKFFNFEINKTDFQKIKVISSFDREFQLLIPKKALIGSAKIEIQKINEVMDIPWDLNLASNIFQFDFKDKQAYKTGQKLELELRYNHQDNNYYQVYFYDNSSHSWKALPTIDYPSENRIRAEITLPFARVAVLANPIMTVGKASWYAYKHCDCAASPDFPKGSLIRVTAVNSNKSIIVKINDWGPERDKHPERVIDLDKVAFKKLAPLGAGVIDVKIEPLHVPVDNSGRVLGVKISRASKQPIIAARSGIIMDQDNRILFEKNSNEKLPLASLTKIVAVKVFLNTKPNLFKVVKYKKQDEEYNYLYVKPWEAAKIRLKEDDQILIKDLLYSALVASANNAVESLVRVSGLNRNEFIARMNKLVKQWGTINTHFIEPTGLSPQNVSSAKDYAIISKRAVNGIIAQISSTPEYSFKTLNTKQKHKLKNTNWLVRQRRPEIIGSKTGYLTEAKHCLMDVVKVRNKRYFLVTLGAKKKNDSFADMNSLIRYIYKQEV